MQLIRRVSWETSADRLAQAQAQVIAGGATPSVPAAVAHLQSLHQVAITTLGQEPMMFVKQGED